jgi:hypothetical protein
MARVLFPKKLTGLEATEIATGMPRLPRIQVRETTQKSSVSGKPLVQFVVQILNFEHFCSNYAPILTLPFNIPKWTVRQGKYSAGAGRRVKAGHGPTASGFSPRSWTGYCYLRAQ